MLRQLPEEDLRYLDARPATFFQVLQLTLYVHELVNACNKAVTRDSVR